MAANGASDEAVFAVATAAVAAAAFVVGTAVSEQLDDADRDG